MFFYVMLSKFGNSKIYFFCDVTLENSIISTGSLPHDASALSFKKF